MFATHGVPQTVQTDNGPPFNSKEFQTLASEMGFSHKITPKHPKAQGQVKGFNKLVNKIATIGKKEEIDVREATYDMLQAYRDTPHPATKETPYELMMNRDTDETRALPIIHSNTGSRSQRERLKVQRANQAVS